MFTIEKITYYFEERELKGHNDNNLEWSGFPFLHPSVTDPAEPNPVDYSPLPSENLASPVPSEYFDFTQLFLCFPSDCAVRIKNPSVFLQTNKPTKKIIKIKPYLLQKSKAIESSTSGSISGTESLVAFWWPWHSKWFETVKTKHFEVGSWMRRMTLERIQILKNCQARMPPRTSPSR